MIDCCDKRLPTLSLDRLNENREVLIDLERSVSHADANVRVHVDGFLAPYGYVLLEALRARRALRGASLTLHETTQGSYAQPFSRIVGFDGPGIGSETTIPLRAFGSDATAAIGPYLHDEWASRARVLGGLTAEYVVDSVAEIFVNALTHAHSDVGVVASGHYFRAREQLELSVLDLGIGIPASIAARLDRREDQIDPARAIAWAFKRGSSSVRTSRGLGLATFYDFLARSEATLVVLSGRGAGRLAGGMWETFTRPTRFPGTLFDLTVPTAKVQRPGAREGTI